ncbi:MAG: hypothetical protein ACFFCE_01695 [Promethearchaeota archaeon]
MFNQLYLEELDNMFLQTTEKSNLWRILIATKKVIEDTPDNFKEFVECVELISNDIRYNNLEDNSQKNRSNAHGNI